MLELSSSRRNSSRVMNIRVASPSKTRLPRYVGPADFKALSLHDVLLSNGRATLEERQLNMLPKAPGSNDVRIYAAGDLMLFSKSAVSIVGTRDVSEEGRVRARRLAKELSELGVVVVSGLARGVDTAAHLGAIENGGRTMAVIGTPLDKAYPTENARIQELIYSEHLLVSPFRPGTATYKSSFPERNRVMAALSDATVIVEASDTSGTLHQAAECLRLGRWLFIAKSVTQNREITWPTRFLGNNRVMVLERTEDIVSSIEKT
jgi:DNA processing protein